ncbi:UxaA family hydrolase [Halocatena marina]|uniref:UxaA family hydrolase n=1 Tax=Halocatena marina TaxID=2934937 RepID=A0ABD5YJR4_9EURY|nr:UxaA family hydrolase [Halocatena marina]
MADQLIEVVESADNVATALRDIEAGETVTVLVDEAERTIEMHDDVEFGHKLALEPLSAGETVTKYGTSIGDASTAIEAGEWVHVHNVESNYGRGDLADQNQSQAVQE